ncbi:MAG TPA: hypothetical protein VKZ43_01150 [Trueperaceae bacterium]|nr:hypothetical protein [Trueperaceae bacterium]
MAQVDDGHDDVVPLFARQAGDSGLPMPTTASGPVEPPPAPEGERFEQLQALFPGRIIDVTRRVQESTGEVAVVGDAGTASTDGYGLADPYTSAVINDSADEPRYDTAAEAASEE